MKKPMINLSLEFIPHDAGVVLRAGLPGMIMVELMLPKASVGSVLESLKTARQKMPSVTLAASMPQNGKGP